MGLFKRLHRITMGRIEAFLDQVEDPERVFPILIEEMEKQLVQASEAEAKASAAVKQAERDLERHQQRLEKYNRGARQALEKQDEDTARLAVEAQIDGEKVMGIAQQNLDRSVDALDRAKVSRKRIQQQLDELRCKKDALLTRARIAKTQSNIQRTVSGGVGSSDSILDAVARLEAHVEEVETQLEIQADLTGEGEVSPSLEKRLRELDHEAEIEKRLSELRRCVSH